MTIKVTCPNGHKLAAKDSKAGMVVHCPACGVKLRIPQLESKGCTDSAVLRILGIGDKLSHARMKSDDSMQVPKDFLIGSTFKQEKKDVPVHSTQVCPQCDWEIDAGYRVCPHCHFYLMGGQE